MKNTYEATTIIERKVTNHGARALLIQTMIDNDIDASKMITDDMFWLMLLWIENKIEAGILHLLFILRPRNCEKYRAFLYTINQYVYIMCDSGLVNCNLQKKHALSCLKYYVPQYLLNLWMVFVQFHRMLSFRFKYISSTDIKAGYKITFEWQLH